ncbi:MULTISPECIES: sensor histidine kinase [Bacillus]|nr:sensor histidine kinase [Bacillus smithii]
MSLRGIKTEKLDEILDKMISTVNQSKNEIFEIGERCRQDLESGLMELKAIKDEVKQALQQEEELDYQTKQARRRLSEVSKFFHTYSEKDIRKAYQYAHDLQTKLILTKQKAKQLMERRDDLERRLKNLKNTIERADNLVAQISVVLKYLTSDMKQIGQALEDAKLKQEFGLRILEAQEEEKKRLSREIHDGPAQMMANVLMRSDLIEKVYKERGVEEALVEIRNLKNMVRSALYEVRRIIYDLRPMALDDLGLVPALNKFLSTLEEYNRSIQRNTTIRFRNIGLEVRLPSKLEIALFRLIQESVQNALKHSNASEIVVKLEIGKEKVLAVIKDNGQGFDIHKRKSNSFGILGMKERMELLEGELNIDSKPGKGTVVRLSVPIHVHGKGLSYTLSKTFEKNL